MALRNQPYIPLYVQDVLTDEKLVECSAAAHGVYLRLLCILHKQESYGVILLKQKYKQTSSNEKNFALMLAKQMPFPEDIIFASLSELSDEQVLLIDENSLTQKRMVKDNNLSCARAEAGKKGGDKRAELAKAKPEANSQANAEIEYEGEYLEFISHLNKKTGKAYKPATTKFRRGFFARLKEGRTYTEIIYAVDRAAEDKFHIEKKFKYLTPEYITRQDRLEVFSQIKQGDELTHPYTEKQVDEITKRLSFDGSYPVWFEDKYKHILNYQTLIGTLKRREE